MRYPFESKCKEFKCKNLSNGPAKKQAEKQ